MLRLNFWTLVSHERNDGLSVTLFTRTQISYLSGRIAVTSRKAPAFLRGLIEFGLR